MTANPVPPATGLPGDKGIWSGFCRVKTSESAVNSSPGTQIQLSLKPHHCFVQGLCSVTGEQPVSVAQSDTKRVSGASDFYFGDKNGPMKIEFTVDRVRLSMGREGGRGCALLIGGCREVIDHRSHGGFPLSGLLVVLQQAVARVGLAGPLQRVGQQLGHAIVQLQGGPSKGHLILIAGALGVQAAHEGEHVLREEGRHLGRPSVLTGPCPWRPSQRKGHLEWVLRGKEELARPQTTAVSNYSLTLSKRWRVVWTGLWPQPFRSFTGGEGLEPARTGLG